MVRKTKEEAQETRNSILQAATDVFLEKGVAGASLENIAEKAGVTRGAIYWHFKNKCDIFEALHEQLHSSFYDMILEDMENDHPQPLAQLEALCVTLLKDVDTNPIKRKVLTVFNMRCDYSGDMECFLSVQNEKKCKSAELFHRYFEKAIARQQLPADTEPCILTLSLFCYTSGIIQEFLRNPDVFDMQKQAAPMMRQFFRGITAVS